MNTMNRNSNITGQSVSEPVSEVVAITAAELEQAHEANYEQAMLRIAHPDPEDQLLHRHNECDGSCTRFRCFR
jgi:hypothetical protein